MSLAPTNRLGPVYTRPKTAAATGTDQRQGTLWVDATYGSNATGTRDESGLPYQTISAALLDSFGGDKIVISPGAYAEALTIPHDLFFDAAGVGGLTSIDISAGRIRGRIGKIEYSETGCIIYSDSDSADNAACFDFALAVGITQNTTRWAIGLTAGGEYDWGTSSTTLYQLQVITNGELIDVYGIGAQKPVLIKDNGTFFTASETNSFKNLNLDIRGGATFSTMIQYNGDATAEISDIVTTKRIVLAVGSGSWQGNAHNIQASEVYVDGDSGIQSDGRVTGIICTDSLARWFRIGNFGGFAELISGGLQIAGPLAATADIVIHKTRQAIVDGTVTEGDIDCIIRGAATEGFSIQGDLTGHWSGFKMSTDSTSILNLRVFKDAKLSDCETYYPFRSGSPTATGNCTIPKEAVFENCTFKYTGTGASWKREVFGTANAGRFDNCIFEGLPSETESGFSVWNGCVLNECTMVNWRTPANVTQAVIRGWDLLANWHDNSGTLYNATDDRIEWTLLGQPYKFDDNDNTVAIANGEQFSGTIYRMDPAGTGDDLSAVAGLFVDFEVVDDAGTWKLRTLASSSQIIDDALGNPAGNLQTQGFSAKSQVGFEATISINGGYVPSELLGQEITLATLVTLVKNGTNQGSGYATIQEAINDAVTGDTIEVPAGNYPEALDMLDKSIHFKGLGVTGITAITNLGDKTPSADYVSASGRLGAFEFVDDGITVHPFEDDAVNFDNLIIAYDAIKAMQPHGDALGRENRAWLRLKSGKYIRTGTVRIDVDTEWTGIQGADPAYAATERRILSQQPQLKNVKFGSSFITTDDFSGIAPIRITVNHVAVENVSLRDIGSGNRGIEITDAPDNGNDIALVNCGFATDNPLRIEGDFDGFIKGGFYLDADNGNDTGVRWGFNSIQLLAGLTAGNSDATVEDVITSGYRVPAGAVFSGNMRNCVMFTPGANLAGTFTGYAYGCHFGQIGTVDITGSFINCHLNRGMTSTLVTGTFIGGSSTINMWNNAEMRGSFRNYEMPNNNGANNTRWESTCRFYRSNVGSLSGNVLENDPAHTGYMRASFYNCTTAMPFHLNDLFLSKTVEANFYNCRISQSRNITPINFDGDMHNCHVTANIRPLNTADIRNCTFVGTGSRNAISGKFWKSAAREKVFATTKCFLEFTAQGVNVGVDAGVSGFDLIFGVGDTIEVYGSNNAEYNGTFTIDAITYPAANRARIEYTNPAVTVDEALTNEGINVINMDSTDSFEMYDCVITGTNTQQNITNNVRAITRNITVTGTGVSNINADYDAQADDEILHVDATAGPITITCMIPQSQKPLRIKKTDATANAVTINDNGGSPVSPPLSLQDDTIEVYTNNTNLFYK